MAPPTCNIIAGPNGAGKTTFAMSWLPEAVGCRNFVNADLIAAGLSPLSPEREWLTASRLFLGEINHYIGRREDFAFETTLSGRTYLRLIRQLLAEGWQVNLYYLWLPSIEMSIARVAVKGSPMVATIYLVSPSPAVTRAVSPIYWNTMRHYAVRPFVSITPGQRPH